MCLFAAENLVTAVGFLESGEGTVPTKRVQVLGGGDDHDRPVPGGPHKL